MNRNIGVLALLFTLTTLVTVGCGSGGAQTTVNVDATVEARVQAANVEATVEARVQATLAANGKPSTPQPQITAAPTPTPVPLPIAQLGIGSKQVSDKDGMTLLYVPAGEFIMGAADSDSQSTDVEKPQHTVYLDAFWIDQTEVTNAMYAKCVKAGVCQAPAETKSSTRASYYDNPQFDNYPVTYVGWDDAKQYCTWVGRDLPTDAQWEKAARGTDGRIYPWGNDVPDKTQLNYNNAVGDTAQVGAYPTDTSPYDALDMAGNLHEWVADWYGETYYASSPDRNPTGPTSGDYRITKGGSWNTRASEARASYRNGSPADRRFFDFLGFRCAQSESSSASSAPAPVQPTVAPQATASPNFGIGPTQVSAKDGMTLLYVPAGEFTMGAADSDKSAGDADKPQHKVYLDAFWIDQTEVTNAIFQKFIDATHYQTDAEKQGSGLAFDSAAKTWSNTKGGDWQHPRGPGSNLNGLEDHPVVQISWNDAKKYCQWAGGDLPTEAQWEKTARGDDQRTYPWGNESPSTARLNFRLEVGGTTEVGKYPSGASPYGALDMAGNVWEWVADWYDERYYASSPDRNPTGPSSGDFRVLRGGGWYSRATDVRVWPRLDSNPVSPADYFGFRCVR